MSRGDIVTLAPGFGLGSKPRPAVIVQADQFDSTIAVTVCPLTTDPTFGRTSRLAVLPSSTNGLREPSWIMIDKVITVYRREIGKTIGVLSISDTDHLDRALAIYLGLAG